MAYLFSFTEEGREERKKETKELLDQIYDDAYDQFEETMIGAVKKIFLVGFVGGLAGGVVAAGALYFILS